MFSDPHTCENDLTKALVRPGRGVEGLNTKALVRPREGERIGESIGESESSSSIGKNIPGFIGGVRLPLGLRKHWMSGRFLSVFRRVWEKWRGEILD